ncbi:MAG: hypothetical protein ACXABY_00635 [Candidatus Thorarchaeota archaeon]
MDFLTYVIENFEKETVEEFLAECKRSKELADKARKDKAIAEETCEEWCRSD